MVARGVCVVHVTVVDVSSIGFDVTFIPDVFPAFAILIFVLLILGDMSDVLICFIVIST